MTKWDDPPILIDNVEDSPFTTFADAPTQEKETPNFNFESIETTSFQEKSFTAQSQEPAYETVWQPIAGTSQEFAITTPAQHTLYHGPRGPGKTATQLMRFRSRVGLGYGSYWRGIIFDREFKPLADLVAQSSRFFPKFEDGCKFLTSETAYKWVWPTGEELLFRHVKKLADYDQFHGHEYPFIGWNELTKWPTLELYLKFMSVNRSSFSPEEHTPKRKNDLGQTVYDTPDGEPLPEIPLEVFSTTNPYGPGHNAVKKQFIDVARSGEIVRKTVSFYDPIKGHDIDVKRTQVAIFGSFYENKYLSNEYRAGLIEACEKDPHLRAAWIEGDWSVSSGGAFDDLWNPDYHILPRFKIPQSWAILDRSFDWGSTHPHATIWWAEASGEEVDVKTKHGTYKFCPIKGSLIAFCELYGSLGIGSNKGNKDTAREIANQIKDIEKDLQFCKWVNKPIIGGPADNQIRDVRERDVDTIELKMATEGVRWSKSDKSAGSRKIGLQLMRERLYAAVHGEKPAIYFMDNCEACIEIIPTLPRDEDDPDDVDTEAEDHLWDATRYRVLKSSNRIATKLTTEFPR